MIDPKIVLLIFASGKIVLTGAKTRNDIQNAFEKIYMVLKKFRKRPPRPTTSMMNPAPAGGMPSRQ
jgi:hypothetical protein